MDIGRLIMAYLEKYINYIIITFQPALNDANLVLDSDPFFVKAKYAKAESLYNMCQFEHALLHYHQGLVRTLIASPGPKKIHLL